MLMCAPTLTSAKVTNTNIPQVMSILDKEPSQKVGEHPWSFQLTQVKDDIWVGFLPLIMMAFSNHTQFYCGSYTWLMTKVTWAHENSTHTQTPLYIVWNRISQGWGPGNIPPSSPWLFFEEQLDYWSLKMYVWQMPQGIQLWPDLDPHLEKHWSLRQVNDLLPQTDLVNYRSLTIHGSVYIACGG